MIVQGLACKLGGSDRFNQEDLKITLKPRIAMEIAAANEEAVQAASIEEPHLSEPINN